MAQQQPPNNIQTIEITNFGGRLTRKLNGDLNSGFAKFNVSWGYDPFSKPDNLTWLEMPTDISGNGPSSIAGLVLDAKSKFDNGIQNVYALSSYGSIAGIIPGSVVGNIYKIQPIATGSPNNPNLNSPSLIGAVYKGNVNFTRGGSIEFFGGSPSVAGSYELLYVGSDNQISTIGLNGSGDTAIGSGGYAPNQFRALKQFGGKLTFANGNTIGAISPDTGTVTSSIIGTGQGNYYSELNPPLSIDSTVHDLDVSIDGNYELITSSGIQNEQLLASTNPTDIQNAVSSDGQVAGWNGSDQTITQFSSIPSYAVTALQTYLGQSLFFSEDAFGSSLNDGTNKILTLTNNKSPLPNATTSNGSFLSWTCPETIGGIENVGSLYYYGALDQENSPGLWRLLRVSPLAGGYVYQMPMNRMVTNKYNSPNSNKGGVSPSGYGRHYFSLFEQTASANFYRLYSFDVTPTGSGVPVSGIYETQTQLFSNRITIKAIRVYCEPTVTGNGFQISLVGSDGATIYSNSYSYAAGTDPTLLQGSLERIDFTPAILNTYAVGLSIGNGGTKNMTIKKIEIDWCQSGK